MALPERPATMMAVRSGASSRSDRMPTRSTVKIARAEEAELESALLRDDAADQERHQRR